jgi:hypothetical protein
MLILEITSSAVITSVPTEAQGRRSRPIGVTPPFVKKIVWVGQITRGAGVNPTSQDWVSHPAFSLTMSVADSLLPPSSKIAFKASVTFARSSSEITLLSDPGASFLFVPPKTMSKRRGQSSIRC